MATNVFSVQANGMNLAYIEQGKGQPVIFVHGGPGDYRAWGNQMEPFAKTYRAISYSRRCSFPNKYVGNHKDNTVANNAEDLAALIGKLGAVPTHLVGHSYGGFIAIYCALKHPEFVQTLALAEPAVMPIIINNPQNPINVFALFLKSPSTAIALAKLANKSFIPGQKAIQRGDFRGGAKIFVNGVTGRENGFEQLPDTVRSMMMDNAESLKGETDASALPKFSREDASSISAPTLLVKGELSPKILRRIVDVLAETLPNNEVVTIKDSSHTLPLEKPEEFNERVLEFLAKHS